jgi:putative membrane protein
MKGQAAMVDTRHRSPITAASEPERISVDLSSRRTGMSFQRTRMSADRTLMSVIRTSLSLIGFGFTIFQFFEKLREVGTLSSAHAARNFGITLVALGIGMLALGIVYHVQFMLGLRHVRHEMTEDGLIHGESRFPPSLTHVSGRDTRAYWRARWVDTQSTYNAGLGAEAADHEVGNAQPRPVEVAMVEQPRPRPGELRQQCAPGCSRHPVCAYERRAARPEPVRGDGDDVGVLADVDGTAVNGQASTRARPSLSTTASARSRRATASSKDANLSSRASRRWASTASARATAASRCRISAMSFRRAAASARSPEQACWNVGAAKPTSASAPRLASGLAAWAAPIPAAPACVALSLRRVARTASTSSARRVSRRRSSASRFARCRPVPALAAAASVKRH